MIDIKSASYQWLILLLLTCVSFGLAEAGLSGGSMILPVLLATFIKGGIVIDRFMALRGVAGPWRFIVLGWLTVILGVIWFCFT
jgi:cytochrome c oxidase subunit 4